MNNTYYCFVKGNKLNKDEQLVFKMKKPLVVEAERKLWFIRLPKKKFYFLEIRTDLERQIMCDRAWYDKTMFMRAIKGVV